jgi:hypothetical protein
MPFRKLARNESMTSVLNVGVMPSNPVGNQIRSLQSQLDAARNDVRTLLLALEAKAPETFAEYVRLKEEAQDRVDAANRPQQTQNQQPSFNSFMQQSQRPLFQPSQPVRGNNNGANGRF